MDDGAAIEALHVVVIGSKCEMRMRNVRVTSGLPCEFEPGCERKVLTVVTPRVHAHELTYNSAARRENGDEP